jgi:FkbM family methyltransferase
VTALAPAPRPLRIARRLAFRVLHKWRAPHPVLARFGGIAVAVPSHSVLAEGIYANAWERHERNVLRRVVRPGTTVLDVGANIGFYTCLFAVAVGPAGRVFAFEPTPSTLALLRANVDRNQLRNVEIEPVALADRDGTATLHLFAADGDPYNSLGASTAGGAAATRQALVRTRRLDDYLERIAPESVSAVKLDVEGAESLVVAGGRSFFARLEGAVLMVELNEAAARQCRSSCQEVVRVLVSELGYRGFALGTAGELRPLGDEHLQQVVAQRAPSIDAFFARPGGVAALRAAGILA